MNKSTIIVPISNYDVNEGFPKSFENNEKFEWYLDNVVNPGRVALLANELNTIDLREKKFRNDQIASLIKE